MPKQYFIIIFALFFIIGPLFSQAANEVPFSFLVDKVKQGQVERIIVRGEKIEAFLSDGSTLSTKKEMSISMSESLKQNGVSDGDMANIAIEFRGEGGLLSIFTSNFLLLFSSLLFFFIPYFIMVGGFKLLKIQSVSKRKVVLYLIIFVFFSWFVSPLLKDVLVEMFDNAMLDYIINGLVSYALILILLRYYFKLTGRNLWMYFSYLIVSGILLGLIITYGLQLLPSS